MTTNGRIPPRQIDATGTRDATTALHGDGTWKASTATPSGAAGGSLAGTYPNPSLAAGAVNSAEINAAIKDAAAATASLRTLGTGALQAAAGNDARLSDARTPLAHTHLIADLPTDVIVPAALGTAAAGTASTLARRDHVHAMPTAADVGAAAAGHTHTLSYGTATELADVDAAAEAAGTSTAVARADHKHGVATAAPVALTGSSQAAGASTSLARADHQHGIPTGIPQANVTNLTTDLAGKAPTTHTHTAADVTDFTEAAQDAVAAMLASGANVTLAYNDAGNSLTITASGGDAELMRDTIGTALVGINGVTVTVNDAADTITLAVSGLTIAQTTGLQAALDGKAAVGHTHAEPFVKLGKSADQSIPGTTWTAITWDIENNDTLNLHNSTNPSRITVASSGLYRTEVHLSLGIGTSTDYYLRFPKNGVFLSGRSAQYVNATSEHTATFSLEVPLVASDYLEARLYASNGATALADNGDIGSVWIVRRVGPTP